MQTHSWNIIQTWPFEMFVNPIKILVYNIREDKLELFCIIWDQTGPHIISNNMPHQFVCVNHQSWSYNIKTTQINNFLKKKSPYLPPTPIQSKVNSNLRRTQMQTEHCSSASAFLIFRNTNGNRFYQDFVNLNKKS